MFIAHTMSAFQRPFKMPRRDAYSVMAGRLEMAEKIRLEALDPKGRARLNSTTLMFLGGAAQRVA